MTEFRRASSAVDALEALLAELATCEAPVPGEALGDAARDKYSQVEQKLGELGPLAEKMRKKCQARHDLEAAKSRLREQLPGAPEECLKVAQELIEKDADAAEAKALQPLLDHALELEGLATYGAKMVEKVQDLLVRYDAVRERFAQLATRLGAAAAAAGADEAERRAAAEREAAARAAEEARRAEEEARRPLAALKAESELRRQEQLEAEERERQRREAEEEQRKREEAIAQAEDEMLRKAQVDGERVLAEFGQDAACAEALVGMLASPVGAYREAVEALQRMLADIASEPEDPRLRVIRVGNEGFQQTLGRRPGVWLFLRGVGFDRCAREALPAGFGAAVGLGTGPPSEAFLVMREPNMMGEYDAWLAWHARVRGIAAFLQELGRLTLQRTSHLGRHGLDVAARGVLQPADVLSRWEGR